MTGGLCKFCFVGHFVGRAEVQKKKAIQLNGLDQLLAERVSAEPKSRFGQSGI
jgi:hypothetical protein